MAIAVIANCFVSRRLSLYMFCYMTLVQATRSSALLYTLLMQWFSCYARRDLPVHAKAATMAIATIIAPVEQSMC